MLYKSTPLRPELLLNSDVQVARGKIQQKKLVMMTKKLLITIDGPAGSGKSTASKALARELSYLYLDTGALYRAIASKVIKEKKNPDDEQAMQDLTNSLNLRLEAECGVLRIILDNEDITDHLRTEEVGLMASKVSSLPRIREVLLPIQQKFGCCGGIVAEGRDMGTVVFPNADLKFFLHATVSERAMRRHRELIEAGLPSQLEIVESKMELRDRQDTERSIAPLKIPADAVVIDSTALAFEEVVAAMLNAVKFLLS